MGSNGDVSHNFAFRHGVEAVKVVSKRSSALSSIAALPSIVGVVAATSTS